MNIFLSTTQTFSCRPRTKQLRADAACTQKALNCDVFIKRNDISFGCGLSDEDRHIVQKIENIPDKKGICRLKFVDVVDLVDDKGKKHQAFAFSNNDIDKAANKSIEMRIFDKEGTYVGFLSTSFQDNQVYVAHINNYCNHKGINFIASGEEYENLVSWHWYDSPKKYRNVGKELYRTTEALIKQVAPNISVLKVHADTSRGSDLFHASIGFESTGKFIYSYTDDEYLVMLKKLR